MVHLLWDASALAKRYVAELGTPTVNALFAAVSPAQMVTTIMSYSEAFAAMLRKRNQGSLSTTAFAAAQAALRNEVIDDPDLVVIGWEFDDVLNGIDLIQRHNLNSTDAAILEALLKRAAATRPATASVLVASDRRMLRAAKAEGLEVINPENVQPADVAPFLAAL